MPAIARKAILAALADGVADMSVAMQSGLARICHGSRSTDDKAGSLPVLVRPYASDESPKTVLRSIKLRSMLTKTIRIDGSFVDPPTYDMIEPVEPQNADGVSSKNIFLATHAGLYEKDQDLVDDVAFSGVWSTVPFEEYEGLNAGTLMGALHMTYSEPTASDQYVSNLYYGIMTRRTKAFEKLSSWNPAKMFSQSDNSRIANKACPADQVAAGASQWAKYEYYGIGSEPSDPSDKQGWDFPRVEAWAKEEGLEPVAEKGLIAPGVVGVTNGRSSSVQLPIPSQPFEKPVDTCGVEIKMGLTKYESQAFFYAQHGSGAPIESVLLADASRTYKHREWFPPTEQPGWSYRGLPKFGAVPQY